MSNVAQISIRYAPFSSFQSVPLTTERYPVTPRVLAQYALYNRDYKSSNYGLDNNDYLTYEGGFITEDSKLNTKYSNFEIRTQENDSSRGGNLSVSGANVDIAAVFQNNISILSQSNTIVNKVINVKSLSAVQDYVSGSFNTDAMTVKDFKRFNYTPGMIMQWYGSFSDLTTQMPYWRLCAPPHAGQTFNGIFVPNLLGRFIPGAVPTDRSVKNTSLYRTGSAGGVDAVNLIMNQMPTHHHNVRLTFNDPTPRFVRSGVDRPVGTVLTYAVGGGINENIMASNRYGTCTNKGITCCCNENRWTETKCWGLAVPCGLSCSWSGCSIKYCWICNYKTYDKCDGWKCRGITGRTAASVATVGLDASMTPYVSRRFSYKNVEANIISQSETDRGGSQPHENRPLFYGLAYIIYVGENQ